MSPLLKGDKQGAQAKYVVEHTMACLTLIAKDGSLHSEQPLEMQQKYVLLQCPASASGSATSISGPYQLPAAVALPQGYPAVA